MKMITIKDITQKIEAHAPLSLAEEWDNCGLQLGRDDAVCEGVTVCLDVTKNVVEQTVESGCNLILSHHPFFFNAVKRIETAKAQGEIVETLLKNGICVYSAHTNLDKANDGICAYLAALFGGRNFMFSDIGVKCDFEDIRLSALAKKIAALLNDNSVRVSGNPEKTVKRAFIISGGGSSTDALENAMTDTDVFITGDVKHHVYVEAVQYGFPIIEFSHFSSEIVAENIFENYIKELMKEAKHDIKIIKAKQQRPFRTLEEI